MADSFFPPGYNVSDTAPNTYEDLVASFENTEQMTVWSGGSEQTIFGSDKQANYAFRAWHDYSHLRAGAKFTVEGEHQAFEEQAKDVYAKLGHTPDADHFVDLLREEVVGQVDYNQAHNGVFAVNQRAFAEAYLKDPVAAVRGDYSKAVEPTQADIGWGRLRDQGDASPISHRAARLAKRLQAKDEAVRAGFKKYSDDQPRDDHGRFASGGGAVAFASPAKTDQTLSGAVAALSGERQALFEQASADIDQRLGIKGQETPIVGAWRDGAENATMLRAQVGVDPEAVRVSAAMKGALGEQKAVLVFTPEPKGAGALYSGHVTGSVADIHTGLIDAGIENHSLAPTSHGAEVYVADLDGSAGSKLGAFGDVHGATFAVERGEGELIGAKHYDGTTDAEQRAEGRAAFEDAIQNSGLTLDSGESARGVWRAVSDRWPGRLAAVTKALSALIKAKKPPPHIAPISDAEAVDQEDFGADPGAGINLHPRLPD